jgi:spore coat protein U-like protein
MKPTRIVLLTSVLVLFLQTPTAFALQCNVSATGLSFGSYDVFSPHPSDTTGSINVTCNPPSQNPKAPIAVTISLSPGSSGSFGQRQMYPLSGGGGRLYYNLYTTASFSTIWGDGSGSSATLSNNVSRDNPWNATIYGRIAPGQDAPVGSYSDVITVRIDW